MEGQGKLLYANGNRYDGGSVNNCKHVKGHIF